MSTRFRTRALSMIAYLVVVAACGPPGLPPAGPEPGEVGVGYGSQPEEKVTGAVTSVGTDELGNPGAGGIEELLRGRAAGLEILPRAGGGYHFRIRGLATLGDSSITGPQDPLFIVDGTPVEARAIETALAGLTRQDIRQVDVLKDVASTSIYGTRGVGGVIVITTRR